MRKLALVGLVVGALAASPADATVIFDLNQIAPTTWELTIEADLLIGDGAIGIVNATAFVANASAADTFFSCAFQTCGTQGPGAAGASVLANAVYFQWAAGGTDTLPFAYGNNLGSPQLMGTITAEGPVSLTFRGIEALFGSPEDRPLSNFTTFDRIDSSEIQGVPEPALGLLAATAAVALTARRRH